MPLEYNQILYESTYYHKNVHQSIMFHLGLASGLTFKNWPVREEFKYLKRKT